MLTPDSLRRLPRHYANAARCREFVMSMAAVLKGDLWQDILASPFVSVLIDESTDISTSQNLIIYIIYLKNGRPKVTFVGLLKVPAATAAVLVEVLTDFFESNGLPIDNVIAFCSDGASVMTGCDNGVGVRLQRSNPFLECIHCIAHRLALCCSDTADDMDYPEVAESLVNQISSYFNRSGKRTQELGAVAKEFQIGRTKIVKSGKTRWLSRSGCVTVLLQLLTVLVTVFVSALEADEVSTALAHAVRDYTFVGVMCVMDDLLALLAMLSQSFQHDTIDYDTVSTRLAEVRPVIIDEYLQRRADDGGQFDPNLSHDEWNVTWNRVIDNGDDFFDLPTGDRITEFLQNEQKFRGVDLHSQDRSKLLLWARKFALALMSRLAERFPADSMEVFKALEIFNPKKLPANDSELSVYGCDEIELLACRYGVDRDGHKALVNTTDLKLEWKLFRKTLLKHRPDAISATGRPIVDIIGDLITSGSTPPNILVLLQIKQVLPYNTAMCERGFSLMKLIKSALRNRLYVETLDALMMVKLVGPDYVSWQSKEWFQRVYEHWQAARLRNPNQARYGNQNASKRRGHEVRTEVRVTVTDSDKSAEPAPSLDEQADDDEDTAENILGSPDEPDGADSTTILAGRYKIPREYELLPAPTKVSSLSVML